jgi:ABC-type amino acid transport substrate-binding protein
MASLTIRVLLRVGLVLACAHASLQPAFAQERPPLRICMAEGNSPLSHRQAKEPHGLDVAIGQAIASDLRRSLNVVFFESEYERETTLSQEVNALLSSGVCSLASAYALFASDLGAPSRPNARTPEHDGGKPRRQRPFVELGKLAATRAYYAMAMGVVTRDSSVRAETLADLQGIRVGAVTGTLAGSALAMYRNGLLLKGLVTLSQRENLLAALEAGRFDATLTPLNRYDAYRLAHPGTPLARAKYVHPLRINLGFAGLEKDAEVLAAADGVIERALASGELERWAATAGASWIRPVPPDINPPFSFGSLRD